MILKRIIPLLLVFQLTFGLSFNAFAQSSRNAYLEYSSETQGPADFIVKRFPNQKLMPTRLLSGVNKPGFYQVPEGTSLLTLVSYSGGFRDNADVETVTIWRQSTKESFEYNLKNTIIETAAADPVLMPED